MNDEGLIERVKRMIRERKSDPLEWAPYPAGYSTFKEPFMTSQARGTVVIDSASLLNLLRQAGLVVPPDVFITGVDCDGFGARIHMAAVTPGGACYQTPLGAPVPCTIFVPGEIMPVDPLAPSIFSPAPSDFDAKDEMRYALEEERYIIERRRRMMASMGLPKDQPADTVRGLKVPDQVAENLAAEEAAVAEISARTKAVQDNLEKTFWSRVKPQGTPKGPIEKRVEEAIADYINTPCKRGGFPVVAPAPERTDWSDLPPEPDVKI